MASRESQGLQISLILFVMISVVLAVTTFVFYRGSQQAQREKEAANNSLTAERKKSSDYDFQIQYLKHVLGATPIPEAGVDAVKSSIAADEGMATIITRFEADMQTLGAGLPPEKRNYRDLPMQMLSVVTDLNKRLAEGQEDLQRALDEKTKLEETERTRADEAHRGQEVAANDLAQVRRTSQEQLDDANAKRASELEMFDKQRRDWQTTQANLEQQLTGKDQQVQDSETTIENQRKRIEALEDQPFEVPDGEIVHVNQRSKLVWVNVGRDDGLTRQTTFSVFAHDAMNIATRSSLEAGEEGEDAGLARQADIVKAKIEITKVFEEEAHLALARIVDDQPGNPIMTGDQIFSPSWKPGRRVHFVLAGVFDLDSDKQSDLPLLRGVIQANGGEIDDEPTAESRYLILGDEPLDRTELARYADLRQKAVTFGLQTLTLRPFLDLMGYKSEVSTRPIGRRRSPTTRDVEETEFRERRPPPSAF